MDLRQRLSENVRILRKRRGLSQQLLADKCGVDVRYINRLENHPQDIGLLQLERLASGLDVTISTLLSEPEAPPLDVLADDLTSLADVIKKLREYETRLKHRCRR